MSIYERCSLGEFGSAELWGRLGVDGDPSKLDNAYLELHRLHPQLVGFLERMKVAGVKVACVSNDITEWSLRLRERHKLVDYIAYWSVSGDVGVRKPSPEIFRHLLRQAQWTAEDCIFVDDRVTNLDGAREVGFKTVQFLSVGEYPSNHVGVANFAELTNLMLASRKQTSDPSDSFDRS